MWTSSLLHPLHSRGSVMTLLAPRDKHGIHHFCTKILSWIHNSEPALESSIFWISFIIKGSLVFAFLFHFISSFSALLHNVILRLIFSRNAHSNLDSFILTMHLHRYNVRLSLNQCFLNSGGQFKMQKGLGRSHPPHRAGMCSFVGKGAKWEGLGGKH